MTREEALDKLCHSYSGYFDVVRHEEPKGYLVAEAGLHIHSEKYVLVKAPSSGKRTTTNMSTFSRSPCSRKKFSSSAASKRVPTVCSGSSRARIICALISRRSSCVTPVSRMRCAPCAAHVFIRASSSRSTAGWITTPASWSSAPAKRLPMAADAVQHSC